MRSPFASLNWGRPTASKRAVYRLRLTDTSVEENMDEITFAEAGVEEYYFDNLLDVLRWLGLVFIKLRGTLKKQDMKRLSTLPGGFYFSYSS